MQATEVTTATLTLPTGETIEQVIIREAASGLYFSVDASYVEQDIDTLLSPYNNGELTLPGDSTETPFVAGVTGLSKRMGRWGKDTQKRSSLGTLTKAQLNRRIHRYAKTERVLYRHTIAMNFKLGETGQRLKQFAALTALRNQVVSRLEAATHRHAQKAFASLNRRNGNPI